MSQNRWLDNPGVPTSSLSETTLPVNGAHNRTSLPAPVGQMPNKTIVLLRGKQRIEFCDCHCRMKPSQCNDMKVGIPEPLQVISTLSPYRIFGLHLVEGVISGSTIGDQPYQSLSSRLPSQFGSTSGGWLVITNLSLGTGRRYVMCQFRFALLNLMSTQLVSLL